MEEDFEKFYKSYRQFMLERGGKSEFSLFKEHYREKQFGLIAHADRDTVAKGDWLQLIFSAFLEYLSPEFLFEKRTAALYTVYCLFATQKLRPAEYVRVSVADWMNILNLRAAATHESRNDVENVLRRMRRLGAFCFAAFNGPSAMCLSRKKAEEDPKPPLSFKLIKEVEEFSEDSAKKKRFLEMVKADCALVAREAGIAAQKFEPRTDRTPAHNSAKTIKEGSKKLEMLFRKNRPLLSPPKCPDRVVSRLRPASPTKLAELATASVQVTSVLASSGKVVSYETRRKQEGSFAQQRTLSVPASPPPVGTGQSQELEQMLRESQDFDLQMTAPRRMRRSGAL